MIRRKISEYLSFARQSTTLLAEQRLYFVAFVCLSVIGALTEGLSISLLVPILETQTGQGSFASIPVLGSISDHLSKIAPDRLIAAVAIVMAVVVVLRNAILYLVDVLGVIIPINLERKLNLRSYALLMDVEIGYINQKEYGELFNGLRGWADRVSPMLTSVALVIWNTMVVAVYAVMMVAISWRLTIAAVIFAILVSLVLRFLTNFVLHRAGERLTAASTRLNQVAMESVTGMKVIRLSAAEAQMTVTYSMAVGDISDTRIHMARVQAIASPMLAGAAGIFICVLLFANALIHAGEPVTWVGPILLFLLLLFRLMGPVSNINAARTRIVSHLHAFDMLNNFFRETEERRQSSGSRQVEPLKEGLRFEEVSFSYAGSNAPAITSVSTTVPRGQMVAVVGPSGAGKSTLIALVTRLHDPTEGRILVDGADLRDFDIHAWRKQLAVVSQDIFIFNDTVANNIAFGRGKVPRTTIEAAAKLAAAHDFIEAMPDGYDTLLGDRGVRLSGGQQQRIAIARAIVASPDLLIFDEATSNLDTFTERAIQDAMEQMAKGRTLIVIAHRLSTIRRADKVIVMEEGRLVEEGTHQELLARRGAYWEMVEHQRLDLVEGAGASAAEHAYQ